MARSYPFNKMFRAPLLLALMLAMLAPELNAQQAQPTRRHTIFTKADRDAAKSSARAMSLRSTSRVLTLNVDLAQLREIKGSELQIGAMPVTPGLTVDLDLQRHDILDPEAVISATDDNGTRPVYPSVVMYRGKIVGDDASDVFIAFSNTCVMGHIRRDEKTYEIVTDLNAPATDNTISAISFPVDEIEGKQVLCGLNDKNLSKFEFPLTKEQIMASRTPRVQDGSTPGVINYSVKGGFDGDYEYSGLFGNNEQAAIDYMLSVAGQVSAIYERDLQTQIVVASAHVWLTTKDMPYTEASVMDLALSEATGYWQYDTANIFKRGFMHVMSGKPWVNPIGIAWLNVLCDNGTSYSAITHTDPARDLRVVSHEIGHNFGLKHTHDCSWGGPENGAIDRCAPAEGGNCFTSTQQSVGTIMSYCSQSDLVFHPIQIDWLLPKINASTCFEQARSLTVYPRRVIFPKVVLNNPKDTTIVALLKNNSKQTVHITKYDLVGDADAFEFEAGSLDVPDSLEPGQTKNVKVTFTAAEDEVPQYLKLYITHDGLNFLSQGPIEVSFEAYAENKRPELVFVTQGSGTVDFGQRPILRTVRDTLTPFFRNQGSAPLHATETMITGKDRFDFQLLAGSAPFDLESGQGREAVVSFTPTTTGSKEAWLVIISNSKRAERDSIKLVGEGTVGGSGSGVVDLQIRSGAINFGNVETFKSYDTTLYNFFYNAGNVPVTMFAYISPDSGWTPNDFNISQAGFVTVDPNTGGDVDLTLYTEHAGAKQAYLIITGAVDDTTEVLYRSIPLLANASGLSAVPGEPQNAQGVLVSPNPAAGDIDVAISPMNGEAGTEYRMQVVNLVGREVYRTTGRFDSDRSIQRVKTDGWANGTYYIRVTTDKGTRTTAVTLKR